MINNITVGWDQLGKADRADADAADEHVGKMLKRCIPDASAEDAP
eukprot:gene17396-8680_t